MSTEGGRTKTRLLVKHDFPVVIVTTLWTITQSLVKSVTGLLKTLHLFPLHD